MSPSLKSPLRPFCWGVLHAIGMFDAKEQLTDADMEADPAGYRTWFSLGEVIMACLLAGTIAVPAGIWFAGRTELSLAFIGAGVLFLPFFVFLPRLVRYAMKADTDAVSKNSCEFFSSSNCASRNSSDLEPFGRNEQTKKVFWALFLAIAGLVLAQVLDPVTAQKLAEILAGLMP